MVSFIDVDECSVMPDICGTAVCKNIPGDFECECAEGYKYNPVLKSCEGRVVTVSLLMVERVGVSLDLRLEALVLFDIQSDFLGWQAPWQSLADWVVVGFLPEQKCVRHMVFKFSVMHCVCPLSYLRTRHLPYMIKAK